MWLSRLKSLRVGTIVSGVANVMVVIVGGIIIFAAFPSCDGHKIFPIGLVSVAAGVKFGAMIKTGMAQEATAKTVVESAADAIIRHERRMRYRTWLWWTRFAIGIAIFQVVGATYLMFNMAKYVSDDGTSSGCVLGVASNGNWWMKKLLVVFVIMVCFVALVQCFIGSDVLRWRSFYATQDDVWKAHYHEVFNHGIREILCCFGRIQYLTVSEEDEIYSVAKLLGDLVSYRASGTGHLELLAGLALLQRHSQSSVSYEGFPDAPQEWLKEAAAFHKFAEAAYTGPLLDVGRNPILFPCAWLYRQGVLSPWTRSRRPTLDGDNWWRGHAAAFLKYIKLSPNVLRQGRVNQEECKAAYFILVLHHLKSVVIAVRGTETPEDLITDGLGRECLLSAEDLDGLMNNSHIHPDVKQSLESSSPHYGHQGIVEAARELYMQVEGNPIYDSDDFGSTGFLSSLLRAGCECEGYNLRLVGHSLGGSIATLLGLRLYGRFPNLHVYAYGALPCVDSEVANACTEFITSVVYENEFSARLSVGSIMRLRASAIMALTQDTTTDTALIFRLARRFLYASKYQISRTVANNSAEKHSEINITEDFNNHIYQGAKKPNRECSLLIEDDSREDNFETDGDNFANPYHNIAAGASQSGDPVSCLMETVSRTENGSATNPTEVFLPGLIIHIVLQQQNSNIPLWASWRAQKRRNNYKAFIANRENFTDIVVSPSMFLDHMPWRCYHAMQKVLEARAAQESQAVAADEPQFL